jgi:hypothetical protein
MADNTNSIEKLYIAYFSRPADYSGMQYWSNALASNPNALQVISSNFASSAEYKAAYAGQTNAQIVNTVYEHLFGRAAEQAGVDYWAKLLDAKSITIDNVVTQIAGGALGSDLFAYNAKVSVATTFTAHLDTAQEQTAYAGAAANQIAINFIATIKDLASAAAASDPGTIDNVIAQIVGTPHSVDMAQLPVY